AGHGHNYILEVSIEGQPSPRTGMLADIFEIDRIVEEQVVSRYDHKNLSVDLLEFSNSPATSELISQEIFRRLEHALPAKLSSIKLHETARNIFEVRACPDVD